MLNQTNIEDNKNNNKFYVIQVLKADDSYYCWSRWGRVVRSAQTGSHMSGSHWFSYDRPKLVLMRPSQTGSHTTGPNWFSCVWVKAVLIRPAQTSSHWVLKGRSKPFIDVDLCVDLAVNIYF